MSVLPPEQISRETAQLVSDADMDEADRKYNGHNYFAAFMGLGLAMLLPYYTFTTSISFWTNESSAEILPKGAAGILTSASTVATVCTLAYLTLKPAYKVCGLWEIIVPLLIQTCVFLLMALWTSIDPSVTSLRFWISAFAATASSMSAGVLQFAVFKLSGRYGPISALAALTGQGISGILPPTINVLSLAALSSGDTLATGKVIVVFFTCSAIASTATLLLSLSLCRDCARVASAQDDSVRHIAVPELYKQLQPLGNAIILVFGITLFMFPAITSSIVPAQGDPYALFTAIHFCVFNYSDLAGRALAGVRFIRITQPSKILLLTIVRGAFLPLFLLASFGVVRKDFLFFTTLAVFGLTNGWLATSCFLAVPKIIEQEHLEQAMGLMTLLLCIGLAMGSILSIVLSWFI